MDMLPVDYTYVKSGHQPLRGRLAQSGGKLRLEYELATGSVETGGVESLLVFFADSIRQADGSEIQQSYSLMNLFKVLQSSEHYMSKFIDELNGFKLVEFILVNPICIVSKQMLDHYLELSLVRQTEYVSVIQSSRLVHHLIGCWRAWHKDLNVARTLYRKLIDLTQPISSSTHSRLSIDCKEDNYFINQNFTTMTQANCLDTLLSILRECLCPCDGNAPKIDHECVELIINLISLLIRHPPRLDLILDIMEFLIFLHPDTKSYTEINYNRISFLHVLYNSRAPNDDDEPIGQAYTNESRFMGPISEVSDEDMGSSLSIGSRDYRNLRSGTTSIDAIDRTTIHRDNSNPSPDTYSSADQHSDSETPEALWDYRASSIPDINNSKYTSNMAPETSQMQYINFRPTQFDEAYKCNHRNYAIALTADMLASIVKLTTKFSPKIIIETMQKSIIEPKKLIILANNDAIVVREKILRLFLSCMRACYSLNIRPILNNYECDNRKGSKGFKYCIPIHLMRFQLIEYPTTMSMIQMCYGIIVGIEEFENVDQLCNMFDIETTNNDFQTNTLIMLIHLMSQLKDPGDICSTLRFVHAYVRQLLQLGENDILTILLENDLVNSLMKIYFTYVDYEIYKSELSDKQASWSNEDENTDDQFEEVCHELDRLIILITRFFIQNLDTEETMRSIDELMTFFDLMNTFVPAEYKSILRNRKTKIVMVMMSYCEHYERVAERKKTGGILDWLTINKLKAFSNYLSESQLELEIFNHEPHPRTGYSEDACQLDNRLFSSTESFEERRRRGSLEIGYRIGHQDDTYGDRVPITEQCVIKRFSRTLDFARRFILTREAGVIPSPLERSFIIRFLKTLSDQILKHNDFCRPNRRRIQGFHEFAWSKMLPKLVETMKCCFKDIVLYLLSPSDSTNLDERRYYAFELMKMFHDEQLIILLDDDSCKLTFGALITFIGDIINREGTNMDSDEYSTEQQADEELLMADTETKLRVLVDKLSQRVNYTGIITQIINGKGNTDNGLGNGLGNPSPDHVKCNFNEIWMDKLYQVRQDAKDKAETLKIEMQVAMRDAMSSAANQQMADPDVRALLSAKLASEAIDITHMVLNDKNKLRKGFLSDIKRNKVANYQLCQQWLSLINGQTHERAMWHLEDFYPRSWELNPIEGPSRVRRRLRPCKLQLEGRFFRSTSNVLPYGQPRARPPTSPRNPGLISRRPHESHDRDELWLANNWNNSFNFHPLCSMIINHERSMDSDELRTKIFTSDVINFNCDCSIIRLNDVCHGELLIASRCVHFIGQLDSPKRTVPTGQQAKSRQASKYSPILTVVEDLWFDEIVEIWDRRYQLQDVGLEIFMTNNMTYLLAFRCMSDREDFKQNLMRIQHKMVNLQLTNQSSTLNRLVQYWRAGRLTNFDFLTCLNKLAGRSFNDLMQYPVFPFVLSNYTAQEMDLNEAANFRDLTKPMAVQNPEKEHVFLNNFRDSQNSVLSVGLHGLRQQPYHYGNHYSNSATVLHFLVRLPPFTQMLIQYQDNNFDQPDRTFHSLASTWQSITCDSNTDFKELIPEFFYLPEMFVNSEQFELGSKQNNEFVDDVRLPPWCPNEDPRLFTLIHRQALESNHVSANLHHWIDLIFGFKQTGPPAVEAMNVFHPATYYGMVSLGDDELPEVVAGGPQLAKATSGTSNRWKLKLAKRPQAGTQLASSWPNKALGELADSSQNAPQLEIERLALATMIKTYGQMPRQIFAQPLRQRQLMRRPQVQSRHQADGARQQPAARQDNSNSYKRQWPSPILEPLKQVKGIRWGSYVGSPEESEITAVRHIKIEPVSDDPLTDYADLISEGSHNHQSVSSASMRRPATDSPPIASSSSLSLSSSNSTARRLRLLRRRAQSYSLCRLANGDVVVLRPGTSLLLDKRIDGKNSADSERLPGGPTARYTRRAGISGGPVNWFMSMILSQQQASGASYQPSASSASSLASNGSVAAARIKGAKLSPAQSSSSAATTTPPSTMIKSLPMPAVLARDKQLTGGLVLVSWSAKAGAVRLRHQGLQRPPRGSQISTLRRTSPNVDQMSYCTSVPELNLVLVGYQSGCVCAHIVSSTLVNGSSQATLLSATTTHTSQGQAPSPSSRHSSVGGADWSSSSGPNTATSTTPDGASSAASVEDQAYEQPQLSRTSVPSQASISAFGRPLAPLERALHQSTRWLYCHRKQITAIQINVNFGILVTGSDDGTSAIWDLNSLTYVRSIDYKLQSLSRKQWAASLRASSANARQTNLQHQQQVRRRRISSSSRDSPSRYSGQSQWQGRNKIGDDNPQGCQLLDYLCSCELQQQGRDERASISSSPRTADQRGPFFGSQETVVQGCVCESGVSLIAISDTLGDIVTIKDMSNRLAGANDETIDNDEDYDYDEASSASLPDELSTDEGHDFEGSSMVATRGVSPLSPMGRRRGCRASSPSGLLADGGSSITAADTNTSSILYCHTVNGYLVGIVNCQSQVTAVCYSNAPEGISVNVIVVGLADGQIRLYNSWDLSRVKELHVSGLSSPITGLMYTRDSQLLYVVYDDDQLVVLRNKRRESVALPKEWYP